MYPVVHSVRSYDDIKRLKEVVVEALSCDPEIVSLLKEGDRQKLIVVKPNWVQESHEYDPNTWLPIITHPNLVLSVLEQLANLTAGNATIVICDAPNTYADFGRILSRGDFLVQYQEMKSRWPQIRFELLDLRREIWLRREEVVVERKPTSEDPRGYVRVNLAEKSHFFGYKGEGYYYGADYDTKTVNRHHSGRMQEYLLAGTPMRCDLFINLPKLKTHKKAGITCCLKNLVGINGDKNWLPHHTQRNPQGSGDEFPESGFISLMEASIKKHGQSAALKLPWIGTWLYRKMRNTGKFLIGDSRTVIRNGDWYGNDTCWRMVLDLNRAFLYANHQGVLIGRSPRRRYLAIVDGIIGGEGNGPLCSDPVASNVLLYGTNPAAVDAVAARLMGFDLQSLPVIWNAFEEHQWPIADTRWEQIAIDDRRVGDTAGLEALSFAVEGGFKPHFGWYILRKE